MFASKEHVGWDGSAGHIRRDDSQVHLAQNGFDQLTFVIACGKEAANVQAIEDDKVVDGLA